MESRNRVRLKQIERQAEGYLELGMAQHALDALAQLGDEADSTVRACYLRGEALRWLERYEEALPPLRKAASEDPENIHAWLALGWCCKRTGRLEAAIDAMERALKAQPGEALLHYNLSCYWSLAGNKERAIGHLSRALAIEPEYRNLVDGEPDFDPIRSDPGFQALLGTVA